MLVTKGAGGGGASMEVSEEHTDSRPGESCAGHKELGPAKSAVG
jgi:hypothetical protein